MLLCTLKLKAIKIAMKLQDDLHQVFLWTVKWQLRLNSHKCDALMITRKHSPLSYTYCIDDSPISWKSIVKYLGIHIDSTLNWTDHVRITVAKATRQLNLLRHSLWGCSSLVKSLVYKSSIWPVLEYAAQVWNPHTTKNMTAIESVQWRAACWATGSQWNPDFKSWTKSSADCMSSLKWPTSETRRIYLCVTFLYDILHKRYSSLHFDSFYKFKSFCTRQHSLCIVPLQATINAYWYSLFVNTPFIWNSVLHSIISITKVESFCKALKTFF